MRRIRPLLFLPFGVLLCASFIVTRGDAQPNTVKQIAPGVWFREGDIFGQGHCNNVIIEMKDYLIVVDANFPSGARLVIEDAKKLSPKPIKYVFDTHHHGDHAYGNAVWTEAGAITLAYAGVTEELKRYEPGRWRDTAKQRPDVADLKRDTAEPPKETFSKPSHVIEDSTRRVEFHFFGWAHTRGDGFVYLPKEKIICTGDAVVNGPYNYTADANIGNWPKVVEKAQALAVDRVLPGHGPAGGKEVLAGQRAFFLELHSSVSAAIKQGKKLDDLVTRDAQGLTGTTIRLSDAVKTWASAALAPKVQDAFKEISERKPIGEIPHP
ncbi:MAG TPA: MBL fold metallo-hydrolase [Bryobacteraceae bacterium]|jgi:glyoxylase-like metal-dependent hydrolase (beta-lactamase superfamily II)|nr:MBL fold metallo-hydrolase [Bryobacteraceae bacterium]